MNPDELGGICPHENEPSPKAPKALQIAFQIKEQAQPPKVRTERTIAVCEASEIPPGTGRIVEDEKISIGVFNLAGRFYAVRNLCPHQGAPLCRGKVSATSRASEPQTRESALESGVIRCPWHGWEFDLVSGKGLADLQSRVTTYEVRIDVEGNIVLLL